MKTTRIVPLILLFALCFSFTAFADVVPMPDDDFAFKHMDECQYVNRVYITNGPEGYVIGHSTPKEGPADILPNGQEYSILYTWQDGDKTWGLIEFDRVSSTWVDMAFMTPRYDSISFAEEHADEIRDESLGLDTEGDKPVLSYLYPGSGIVIRELDIASFFNETNMEFSSSYTDAEGRLWGYCGYFYGMRNVWVCLDEPYEALPAGAEYREPEIYPAADEEEMAQVLSDVRSTDVYVIIIIIAVVFMAAAVIAYIILRRKRA